MSDVSKTNELIKALNVAREHFSAIAGSGEIQVCEDTGEKRGIDHQAKTWADRGARLTSEALAATRVPVQGEPNDDMVLAALVAAADAAPVVQQVSESDTLALVDEVIAIHADRIDTHYGDCYKYHVACLAAAVKHRLARKGKNE